MKIAGKELPEETIKKACEQYGISFDEPFKGLDLLNDEAMRAWLRAHRPNYAPLSPIREIREIGPEKYLLLSLPSANEDWTYAVWEYAMTFCKRFGQCYPVHFGGKEFDNSDYVYIKL